MTISKDLLLAILSMDSYNRGYGAGLADEGENDSDGLGDSVSTKIGSATIVDRSDSDQLSPEVAAGFYAIAYKLDEAVGEGANVLVKDTTIISYRGTDDFNIFNPENDVFKGWVTAGGAWGTDQVRLAAEFYQSVTGTTTSDPRIGSAVLTDHSLGGGLDELDIVSISVNGDGVESITPTGTTLREGASFTFGDGTTGNTYEAIFETDATDTIFRGVAAANDNRIDNWMCTA